MRIIYLVCMFLNGINGFLKAERTPKMINVQVDLSLFQLCKQWPTKISEIVCKDRHMSIWMIAETVNADKETARRILHDKLNMKKVCVKLLPKNLNPDQKLVRQIFF